MIRETFWRVSYRERSVLFKVGTRIREKISINLRSLPVCSLQREGKEVRTREVPEDDVPGEYLDKE